MKRIYIIFAMVLLSVLTISGKEKEKEATSTNSFEVIANPVSENLIVKFNININIESIKVIDNSSAVVFETGKSRGAAGAILEIPVEDMEAGTYFVRVQTETGTQVQRIIISKT